MSDGLEERGKKPSVTVTGVPQNVSVHKRHLGILWPTLP